MELTLVKGEQNFENGYNCDICGKTFSRKVQFKKHCLQHASIAELDSICPVKKPRKRKSNVEKISTCKLCGKKFKKLLNFNRHCCIRQKSVNCNICKKDFRNRYAYNLHKCSKQEEKPFSCSKCKAQFSWRDQISYHSCNLNQADQSLVSENYPKNQSLSSTNQDKLLSSTEDVESDNERSVDKSSKEESQKIISNKYSLFYRLKCKLCGREFKKPHFYNKHKLLCNPQKIVQLAPVVSSYGSVSCNMCMKVFPHRNAYNSHACAKYVEKPFSCSKCKAQFSWQDQLRYHSCDEDQDNQTVESENKQNQPSKCETHFSWQDQLHYHSCNEDQDNQTVESENKQNHPSLSSMNIDLLPMSSTNDSITCGICKRSFAQKGHLILHYRRTHKRQLIYLL